MSWNRNTQFKTVGKKTITAGKVVGTIYALNKLEDKTGAISTGFNKAGKAVDYGVKKAGKLRTSAGKFGKKLADSYRDGRNPGPSGFQKFKDRVVKLGVDVGPKIKKGVEKVKTIITPESNESKLMRSKSKFIKDSVKNSVIKGSSNAQLLFKNSNVGKRFLTNPTAGKQYVKNMMNPLLLSKYNQSTPKSVIADINKKKQDALIKSKQSKPVKTPKVITPPAPTKQTWTQKVTKTLGKTNTAAALAPLFTPTVVGMKAVKGKTSKKSKVTW